MDEEDEEAQDVSLYNHGIYETEIIFNAAFEQEELLRRAS
jgi:inner membrane protein involved in colicin E2 resistance